MITYGPSVAPRSKPHSSRHLRKRDGDLTRTCHSRFCPLTFSLIQWATSIGESSQLVRERLTATKMRLTRCATQRAVGWLGASPHATRRLRERDSYVRPLAAFCEQRGAGSNPVYAQSRPTQHTLESEADQPCAAVLAMHVGVLSPCAET